jgi:hypothetical protein
MSTAEKKQDAFKGCGAPVMSETFKGRSAGGIGGSGIYGGIGAGVVCDSKDTSFYCMFIKFVTVIIYLCLLYIIFSTVYNFFKTTKLGRRIFGGR